MKYNININQKAIIDLGLNLDVIDMSIFDFIKDFANSKNCVKVFIDGKQYFWISHTKIITDLPIIRINTRQGIINRINKLIESGLIERVESDLQRSYYCFGDNYDNVLFVAECKQPFTPPVNETLQQPVNDRLHNNSITNNNTIDNKDDSLLHLVSIPIVKKLKRQKKEVGPQIPFIESTWNSYDTLKAELAKDEDFKKEFAGVCLKSYIEDVLCWSEKGNVTTNNGWYLTLRRWMRTAKNDGKLMMLKDFNSNKPKGHINY